MTGLGVTVSGVDATGVDATDIGATGVGTVAVGGGAANGAVHASDALAGCFVDLFVDFLGGLAVRVGAGTVSGLVSGTPDTGSDREVREGRGRERASAAPTVPSAMPASQ